jgi:uncharacterized protein YcbX
VSLRWLEERRPVDQVDQRRFRPNLVVDRAGSDLPKEASLGRREKIGGAGAWSLHCGATGGEFL